MLTKHLVLTTAVRTVEQLHPVGRVEDEVKVVELDRVGDVVVHAVQAVAPLGRLATHGLVRVEPAPARVLLQAVHEVVHVRIPRTDRVLVLRHDVIQQLAVKQRQRDHVAALGHGGVDGPERLQCVGIEVLWVRHVVEPRVAVAHVVADETEPHKGRVVRLLVARHRLHQFHGGRHSSAVHTDVLEVCDR